MVLKKFKELQASMFTSVGKKILSLNPSNNIIAECGCFKGASSIYCQYSKIVNRKLIICELFEGLQMMIILVSEITHSSINW